MSHRAACPAHRRPLFLLLFLLLTSLHALVSARKNQKKFVLIFADDEAKKAGQERLSVETSEESGQELPEQQDEFSDVDDFRLEDLDPGSWKMIAEGFADGDRQEEGGAEKASVDVEEVSYIAGVHKMLDAASHGDPDAMAVALDHFQHAAHHGHAHAQSSLAFLYGNGIGVEHSDAKAFLYHSFAAEGGNFQSKLALAYSYFRQQMTEEAVKLYAELAATAVASFSSALDSPLVEPVPLNDGLEENKEALRRSRGEEDDDFQILEYQARKGNAVAMFKVGVFYYSGLRGVRRDDAKALDWFLKAVEKGDSTAMEFIGEIYARGHGVERNFTRALDWFKAALISNKRFSVYNGIGYLYVKGQGVEKRNYTVDIGSLFSSS